MNLSTFNIKVKNYTEKLIKKLEEIKKINDVGKQCSEVSVALRIHKRDFNELKNNKPENYSSYSHHCPFNLDKYKKKIEELEELEKELLKKSIQLKKIESGSCSECKKKITLESCYVYLWNKSKIKKWAVDKVSQFSYEEFERHVPLFCSESCFKQSHWSSKPNDKPNKENDNEDKPEKQKENNICWECHKTKSEKWFINQDTGLEFCSQACNLEHNAELCEDCVQKCLKYEKGIAVDHQAYYRDSKEKVGTLCFNCKQKHKKELAEELKRLEGEQEADKEELERIKSLIENGDDDNQESRIKNQESRIKNQESRIKNQESRIKNQESRIKNQESRIKNQESRIKNQESNSKSPTWNLFLIAPPSRKMN